MLCGSDRGSRRGSTRGSRHSPKRGGPVASPPTVEKEFLQSFAEQFPPGSLKNPGGSPSPAAGRRTTRDRTSTSSEGGSGSGSDSAETKVGVPAAKRPRQSAGAAGGAPSSRATRAARESRSAPSAKNPAKNKKDKKKEAKRSYDAWSVYPDGFSEARNGQMLVANWTVPLATARPATPLIWRITPEGSIDSIERAGWNE